MHQLALIVIGKNTSLNVAMPRMSEELHLSKQPEAKGGSRILPVFAGIDYSRWPL